MKKLQEYSKWYRLGPKSRRDLHYHFRDKSQDRRSAHMTASSVLFLSCPLASGSRNQPTLEKLLPKVELELLRAIC